jgi:transposase-like protein
MDETIIKADSESIWIWVDIEFESKEILGLSISKDTNTFVTERFMSNIVYEYGYHLVSTDCDT